MLCLEFLNSKKNGNIKDLWKGGLGGIPPFHIMPLSCAQPT